MATKASKRRNPTKERNSAAVGRSNPTRQPVIPQDKTAELKGKLLVAITDPGGNIMNLIGMDDPRILFCKRWNGDPEMHGDKKTCPFPEMTEIAGEARREFNPREFARSTCSSKNLTQKQIETAESTADKLTALTGGKVQVDYCYDSFLGDDRDVAGHLFDAKIADDPNGGNEVDIYLDDRKPDLKTQLIAELRRVGEHYYKLADELKKSPA